MADKPPYRLDITTRTGKPTAYRIVVSGDMAAGDNIDEHAKTPDNLGGSGHACMGVIRAGLDTYYYDGRKKCIETNDLDGLMLAINGGPPHPARAYDTAREADFSEEFPVLNGDNDSSMDSSMDSQIPERAPDPENPPDLPKYQDPELGDVGRDEAIGGGLWIEVENPDPATGFVSRFASSKRDTTIHVDENDSGGVQAALNRLPREINHHVTIELSDGHHTGNGSSCRTGFTVVNSRGRLRIDGSDRDSCRVAQGINGCYGGKLLHNQIRNISWSSLSQFSGPVDIRDCVFSGFETAGVNSTGTAAISGKNGFSFMKRCIIGDDGDQYSLWPTQFDTYGCADCEFNATVAAVNRGFATDFREGWGNVYNTPKKYV